MAAAEPEWQVLQKKIFARFVNQKYKAVGSTTQIKSVIDDFKDGILFLEFLEAMSGKHLPEADKKKLKPSTTRIQQVDNLSKILSFAQKDLGLKFQANAENFVDGTVNMIMGTIYQIILKYMKIDDDDGSADFKEAMMLWLKNRTAGYNGVKIENFGKSFHDGLAFCALIHKMRPKLINFDSLNAADKIKNLDLALDTAAKYCNVEKYLKAEDIAKLDELSMLVYLTDWYNGISLLAQQDAGARRIGKLVVMTQTHDRMRAQYSAGSQKLVGWIDGEIKRLDDHSFDNTLEGIRQKIQEFYQYKITTKPPHISEHMDLEALFNDLALRLQNNKRPQFSPPAGLSPADLQGKLEALEASENKRNSAMQAELQRQIRLDKAAKRFAADGDKFANWVGEKEKYLSHKEEADSVAKAQGHLNSHASYEADYEHVRHTRLAALKTLAGEIIGDNYCKKADIQKRETELDQHFQNLKPKADAKKKTLEEDLTREKHKDKLRVDFAAAAQGFESYVNDLTDTCAATYFGDNYDTVSNYKATLDKSNEHIHSHITEKKKTYDAIWTEMQSYHIKDNQYTPHTHDSVESLRKKLETAVSDRNAAYAKELAHQKANDDLCKSFADAFKGFSDWLAAQKTATNDKSSPLVDQLKHIDSAIGAQNEADTKLKALDELSAKITAAEIGHNKYTNSTAGDARTAYQTFQTVLSKRKALLESEIQKEKDKGLTQEQKQEIKQNFAYFDRNKNGQLDKREFRSCLQSLGLPATADDVKKVFAQYGADGPNGILNETQFQDFMLKRIGDTDTKDEILNAFKLINQAEVSKLDLLNAVVNETTFKQEYVDYLSKEMKATEGGLNHKQWTDEVFAR